MLLLVSTSDKIQVVTGSAVAVDVHASYWDYDTAVTPGRKNTAISTATTTDVVASPGSGVRRKVRTLTVRNTSASASVVVTVKHTDGTTAVELKKVTLLASQQLVYAEDAGFVVMTPPTAPGLAPLVVVPPQDQLQIIGASDTQYLNGSAIVIPPHRLIAVGTIFRWRLVIGKTAAGTASASFDIRFGVNGNTSDTSRANFVTGAQTANAGTAWIQLVALVRGAIGGSCVVQFTYFLTNQSGFDSTNWNRVSQVSATFDVTTAGIIVGVSVTTGAAHVYTVYSVAAEARNI